MYTYGNAIPKLLKAVAVFVVFIYSSIKKEYLNIRYTTPVSRVMRSVTIRLDKTASSKHST